MRTSRRLWFIAAGAACVLGLGGTVATVSPTLLLWTGFALAMFGGLLAVAFKDDLAGVRHPVLWGAALAVLPALLPGLSRALGDATIFVLTALVVGSPWVVARIERRLRPWLGPSRMFQAGMAAPDEALRRQWAESTRQLGEATSVADRLIVVHVREQILDDVAARHGGELPSFVRDSFGARGGIGHRSDEPHRPG
jgi:hypothetical protein